MIRMSLFLLPLEYSFSREASDRITAALLRSQLVLHFQTVPFGCHVSDRTQKPVELYAHCDDAGELVVQKSGLRP